VGPGDDARDAPRRLRGPERIGISDEQRWRAVAPLLEAVFEADRYPTAARVGAAAGAAYDPEHAFEFGRQRVLDGIEALVHARAAQPDRA
jgi:hypothetical protein